MYHSYKRSNDLSMSFDPTNLFCDKFEQRIRKEIIEPKRKGVGGQGIREMFCVLALHTKGLV